MTFTTLFPSAGFGNFPFGTFRQWLWVAVVVQPLPGLFPTRATGRRCGGCWRSLALSGRICWFRGGYFCREIGWRICWVCDGRSYGRCNGRRSWWRIIIGLVTKKSIVFAVCLTAFEPRITSGNLPGSAAFLRLAVVLSRPNTVFHPTIPLLDVTSNRCEAALFFILLLSIST